VTNTPANDSIWIVGYAEEEDKGDGADRALWSRKKVERELVSTEVLRERVEHFIDQMRGVLANVPEHADRFRIEEIELTLEISAKGSVNLLGTGGEVGGTGGITVSFKRR